MDLVELNKENEEFEIVEDLNSVDDNLVDFDDSIEIDYDKTEYIYFDENNIIIEDEDKAVKRIARYFDYNGNFVQETVSFRNTEDEVKEEFVVEYTDEQGNIVDEKIAYYAVYKRILNGEVVNEEKVIIERNDEMSL